MKFTSLFSTACLLGSLLAPAAHAAVIDFEDIVTLDCVTAPINSHGLVFSTNGVHCVAEPADGAPNANNGTSFLIEGGQLLTITHQGSQRFSVTSLDLGTSFYNPVTPNSVRLTGLLADGSSVVDTVEITDVFQTYGLLGFNDLVSLQLEGPLIHLPGPLIDYYALDNVVFTTGVPNPVPEPATLTMLAAGAGLLAWRRRQR